MISATLLAPVPCLVMICWFSTSGVASMLNITLIAADRYLYVVHPYFHTRLVTPRSTAACVTVVWLLAVAYGTVPAYAHKPDHDDSLCDFPDVSLVGHFVYASFGVFSFSCTTTLVLYCLVARLVYKKLRNPLPVPVPACGLVNGCRREGPLYFNNTCTRESHLRKVLQSVRAPAVVFGVFVLCWTPHFVAQFIHVASPVRVPYRAFCTIGGLLNSAMNFFVYVILNPNFRKELVSRWKRRISAEVTDGRASRVTPRTSRVTTSRVTVPVL
ncbi:hypothetical protein BaRGS_00015539 [Batillaria attramentaria]|uniref:G-protein coupled receptors family 1 profile domain-containing protein n=1 Tax=Batillaria attramentaria TaxID=370345 RepID=A0ABD0L1C9_9CAEN